MKDEDCRTYMHLTGRYVISSLVLHLQCWIWQSVADLGVVHPVFELHGRQNMPGTLTHFHYPVGPMLLRKTWVQRASHTYFSVIRLLDTSNCSFELEVSSSTVNSHNRHVLLNLVIKPLKDAKILLTDTGIMKLGLYNWFVHLFVSYLWSIVHKIQVR